MAPKTFTVPRPSYEPEQFTIQYQLRTVPEVPVGAEAPEPVWEERSEQFLTVSMVSAGALLDFGKYEGQRLIPIDALLAWFDACLPNDELARFTGLIHDKDVAMPIETLGEVAEWLGELFSSRPTLPSDSSPSGSTPAGDGPTVPAPSAD